jgi:NitT/TauT family transport system substrate-binding protein
MDHRMQAAEFAGRHYYNQNPDLLRFVLSKPPDRVKYTNLRVVRKDFEEIQRLGVESGILQGTATFDEYTDASFVPDEAVIQPYEFKDR